MKQGITFKLVVVLLISSTLLVGAMALAMRWSFQKGFLDYLTEAELARLDQTALELAETYEQEGSWDFIRGKHHVWAKFLPHNQLNNPTTSYAPPTQPRVEIKRTAPLQFGKKPPPPSPNDHTGLSTRLRLLDAEKYRLIGPTDRSGEPLLRPIELYGEVVGWLSLTRQPAPSSSIDQSFREQQLNAIYPIALGALLLALMVGIPAGRRLTRPVKALAEGAHKLSQGRFDTRIEPHSSDELGQLALDFNGLAKRLEKNEVLRRHGMADISHELRTPLALLRGEIEAMQDGIRPLDTSQLAKLHNSTQQLSSLVDDLYDLALTDAGALNYRKERLDLTAILTHAISAAEHPIIGKGLTLQVDVPEELIIFGDGKRLRQVIDNLLKNSCRYTHSGGVILVTAWRDGPRACFKVEDSTPGVGSEMLEHLFDRFYRGEVSRSRATGGAGLGLAICRNIIDAHQGSVAAFASKLGGVQIVVNLPVKG